MHCRGVGGLGPEKTLLELEQLNGKVMQMELRKRVWGGMVICVWVLRAEPNEGVC